MRLAPLALCALLLAPAARGQENPPLAIQTDAPAGYAFAYPRLLVQQQLFGLAHAIALLAAACGEQPGSAAASREAHAAWRERQTVAIDTATADLGRYYFGNAAADGQALVHAMQLRESLELPPATLAAACATLAEALGKPRYDLAARYALEEAMAIVGADLEATLRDDRCHRLLAGDELRRHQARYAVWREINEPLAQKARDALERTWPEDGPTPSFAEWLTRRRHALKIGGDRADCLAFSTALKQPESSLRHAFSLPPFPRREAPE